jgi:LysM repeat protein
MRQRWSTICVCLLVVAVVLGGLAGCSKEAQVRETEGSGAPATTEVEAPPGGESTTPAPGQTVVSAVTPAPGESTPAVVEQPTEEPATGAPTAAEPASPTEPAATEVPPATEAPASGTGEETVVHTVKRGDTLSSIALRYDTTVKAIKSANNIKDTSVIRVGQKLEIPTSGSSSGSTDSTDSSDSSEGTASGCSAQHKVKKGEWVWQIARDYGVSPYDILAANNLTIKRANTIAPGRVLCIP